MLINYKDLELLVSGNTIINIDYFAENTCFYVNLIFCFI